MQKLNIFKEDEVGEERVTETYLPQTSFFLMRYSKLKLIWRVSISRTLGASWAVVIISIPSTPPLGKATYTQLKKN